MCDEKEMIMFTTKDGVVLDVTTLVEMDADPRELTENLKLSTMDRHNFMYKFAEANPAKGKKGGSCNITQCQKKGASCYNGAMTAYYCTKCWDDIYNSATYYGLEPQDWIKPEYRKEDHSYVYGTDQSVEDLEELYQKVQNRSKRVYRGREKNPYLQAFGFDPSSEKGHMPWVREEAKIGRNQQCPCGSGKKYKKCCEVFNG